MAPCFSKLFSEAMDCLGYSEQMIGFRAYILKEIFDVASERFTRILQTEMIPAGSKSEGVVPFMGSDFDTMIVSQFLICVDHGRLENKMFIIVTDTNECPPGYTKLRPLVPGHCTGIPSMLNSGYLDYIPSATISEMFKNMDIPSVHDGYKQRYKTLSGPALSSILQFNALFGVKQTDASYDNVIAIRYYTSTILREWAERSRQFDWPPPDVIEDVSTTEGYIVPVGHKFSEEQSLEWRICFTTGERKLVSSFNSTQLKLYVVLKMVVKDILKPVVDCVSSYMVKNIVFWVMEHNPTFVFTPSNLTKCVIHALWFLLHCLHNNNLPNYMIPNRNLLLGRIQGKQKAELRDLTRELLNEGETIVLKCEKLKNAMYVAESSRTLASMVQSWRDEIEQLYLLFSLKLIQNCTSNMVWRRSFLADAVFEYFRDESYLPIICRLLYLLSFNMSTGGNFFQNVMDVLHNLLS
ncbi:uncharacterized protein LOC132727762 [Ruditapes philippinarum]|uniref:uncharacterized protein LOC132727762 n=1 Tax=Ruditapes philippinarum TaxID=129788 RepID=UPI00295A9347|nr:uncharacterized protein LOC132727762 [Ruditapes philippinarum]